ncbi:MAG TPA: GH25 family lysozyme [Kofleriaceae bacterium]|nr:GH25 family lysozyme [Kofleriaceae bacterium]
MSSRVYVASLIIAAGCAADELATTRQAATVCETGTTVHGMDVSSYDTVTDWNAAKAAGIDFAFVRASDGTQYPDPDFAKYWAGARSAGVIRGAYQYFRPDEDPIAQADLLLTAAGPYQAGDLPPVLDLEVADGLSTDQVTAAARAWVDHVQAAIGRPPIVYAGLYSWPSLTEGADFTTSPLWIAQYTTAACPDIPSPWTRWLFWQDSSTGSSAGVSGTGALDVDVFSGTLDDLVAFAAAPPASCGTVDATTGAVIDNGDACYEDGGPPAYLRDVTTAGYGGSLAWTHATDAATESNFAQWNLDFAAAGPYLVEAYTDHAYATSHQAAYAVHAASGDTIATIDQAAADGWQTVGTFQFGAGGDQWIHLSDNTGEPASANAQLVFDAIRLTPLDPPPTPTPSPSPTPDPEPDHHHGGCSTSGGGAGWLAWLAIVVAGCARTRRAQRRLAPR